MAGGVERRQQQRRLFILAVSPVARAWRRVDGFEEEASSTMPINRIFARNGAETSERFLRNSRHFAELAI
jgi:hypothetical protein